MRRRCSECGALAEYDSPRLLCERHWLEWFNKHLPPKEREVQVREDATTLHRLDAAEHPERYNRN